MPFVIVGCVVVLAAVGFFYNQQQQAKQDDLAAKREVDKHWSAIADTKDVDKIADEIAWLESNRDKFAEHIDGSRLSEAKERLETLRQEKQLSDLEYAAQKLADDGDKEAAVSKLQEAIAYASGIEALADRADTLRDRILRLDPDNEAAHEAAGNELVEHGIPNLNRLRPFFPDAVDDLAEFGDGKYLPPEQAAEKKQWIEEKAAPIRELLAKHEGDPLFARALERIEMIMQDEWMAGEDWQAYYDDKCLVMQAKSGGRTARRHMAILNLESMKFAQQFFESKLSTLGHELTRMNEPMVLVSLRDKQAYVKYNESQGAGELAERARAYFMPSKRWIITYNEDIFSARFRNRIIAAMVGTSIHEGAHHIRWLYMHGQGRNLSPSHWFEEGWAEYTSGIDVSFDPKTEVCTIDHCGWNNARMEPYASPQGGMNNPTFKRLSLKELVGLHSKADEIRIAGERGGFVDGNKDIIGGLVYSQGFSFIYFCYEGSKGKYKKQIEEWRDWQWSRECSPFGGSSYKQAWKKFEQIFGDTAKVDAEWKAWEDSLDVLEFDTCSPKGFAYDEEEEDEDEDEE